MVETFEELHEELNKRGIEKGILHKFAERLFIVNRDVDFIEMALKGLDGNMLSRISVTSNKKSVNDCKKELEQHIEKSYQINETDLQDNEEEKSGEEKIPTDVSDEKTEEVKEAVIDEDGKKDNVEAANIEEKEEVAKEQSDDTFDPVDENKIIKVRILGAIKNPGYYDVEENASVEDVIALAGDLTEAANIDTINFSQELYDGALITIKKKREIRVDVEGAVNEPGIKSAYEGDRIGDVIEKAGGFSDNADTTSINQADKIKDGEQYIVPFSEEKAENVDETNLQNNDEKPLSDVDENKSFVPEETVVITGIEESTTDEPAVFIDGTEKSEDETIEQVTEPDLCVQAESGSIIVEQQSEDAPEKKTSFLHKRFIHLLSWIKAFIMNGKKRLPMSVQDMLEKVEDPFKLQLLIGAYNQLTMSNFERLLKIQDKTSMDRLKELTNFYISVEPKNS